MKYETTPIRPARKRVAKPTTRPTIEGITTLGVIWQLYKRHEMPLVYTAFICTWTWILVTA